MISTTNSGIKITIISRFPVKIDIIINMKVITLSTALMVVNVDFFCDPYTSLYWFAEAATGLFFIKSV